MLGQVAPHGFVLVALEEAGARVVEMQASTSSGTRREALPALSSERGSRGCRTACSTLIGGARGFLVPEPVGDVSGGRDSGRTVMSRASDSPPK